MTYTTGLPASVGTTFDLPNFTGILYQLTPQDTPFFSAIGGLSGGMSTNSTEFEWQTATLRNASKDNQALEGQDAPDAVQRDRSTAYNTVEIHQSTVGTSYTKLAAIGNIGTFGGSDGLRRTGTSNPVTNELDWQTRLELAAMLKDVELSFLEGTFQRPTNNSTPRKTRGLLSAITTNRANAGAAVNNGTGATATATTDVFAATAHGLSAGDQVQFSNISAANGLTEGQTYYVSATGLTANAFKVSATPGGSVTDVTADSTVDVAGTTAVGTGNLNALMQTVYSNGGLTETATATLMVPPAQKPALTAAYVTNQNYMEQSRTVGGVSVQTLITDFGVLNIMLNRHLPSDTIVVVSLEECAPVWLNIPGKGHFFAEPLAKTGAYEKIHLYGEVGLNYGNEYKHGVITGLSV